MRLLCQVLGVTPSRYYAWGVRVAKMPELVAPAAWGPSLVQTFTCHKQRYGTRRLRAELQAQGYRMGRQRLRRRALRAVQQSLPRAPPTPLMGCVAPQPPAGLYT